MLAVALLSRCLSSFICFVCLYLSASIRLNQRCPERLRALPSKLLLNSLSDNLCFRDFEDNRCEQRERH